MAKPVERGIDRRQRDRRSESEGGDRRALDVGPPERRQGERRQAQEGPPERRSGSDRRHDELGMPKGVYVDRRRKADPRRPEIHESTLAEWLDCRERYAAEHAAQSDEGEGECPPPENQRGE